MSAPHPRHVERIRKMKQRLAVRAWEYRQRDTSKGVWDRLRALLALSEHALALDEAEVDALLRAGHAPHRVGAQLAPARRYFVLTPADASAIARSREIPLRLDTAFLAEPRVALVLFPGIPEPR